MVRLISEKCPEIVDERNEDGDTAYMLAIFRDHRDIIQQLQSISDVSLCDNNGHNAFMVAAANGDLETLADLALNENAKVLGRNNEGQTALHRACFFG